MKKRLSLDMNAHTLKQLKIQLTDNVITSKGGGLGVALSLRGYYDFTDLQSTVAAAIRCPEKIIRLSPHR